MPYQIDGKANPLYSWWYRQRQLYKDDEMLKDRIRKFKDSEINLSIETEQEIWKSSFNDFCNRRDSNGSLVIQARINGKLTKEYRWLYKQKQLFKDKKLSKDRIQKFKDAGIDLSK